MFHTPIRKPGAGAYARYRDVDVAARVEGASPHALIAVLFEELLKALDTLSAATASGDRARVNATEARALSLLHGLEGGLDFERGGEIAQSLGKIYREARRLLGAPGSDRLPAIAQARTMIADIAGAWSSIS